MTATNKPQPDYKEAVALYHKQISEFTNLIARGKFPLRDHAQPGQFHLLPGAYAALERVDTVWREAVKREAKAEAA